MILDANGCLLTPLMIDYCLDRLPEQERRRCRVLLSPSNLAWLRTMYQIERYTAMLTTDSWIQEDAVFIMGGEDGLTQLWLIKNLFSPEDPKTCAPA